MSFNVYCGLFELTMFFLAVNMERCGNPYQSTVVYLKGYPLCEAEELSHARGWAGGTGDPN